MQKQLDHPRPLDNVSDETNFRRRKNIILNVAMMASEDKVILDHSPEVWGWERGAVTVEQQFVT